MQPWQEDQLLTSSRWAALVDTWENCTSTCFSGFIITNTPQTLPHVGDPGLGLLHLPSQENPTPHVSMRHTPQSSLTRSLSRCHFSRCARALPKLGQEPPECQITRFMCSGSHKNNGIILLQHLAWTGATTLEMDPSGGECQAVTSGSR